jgi:ribosomal protein S18 acetylase RimI-like enzyme
VNIRKAGLADAPAVIRLWKALEAHHRTEFGFGAPGAFAYKKDTVGIYKKFLLKKLAARNAAVFVAEDGGRAIGYVMASVIKLSPILVHDREAFINELVVEKAHRRKGVGTMLLGAAERWAKKRGLFWLGLTVHAENKAAFAAYKKFRMKALNVKMVKIVHS